MQAKVFQQFNKGKKLEKPIHIGDEIGLDDKEKLAYAMDLGGENILAEMGNVYSVMIAAHGILIKGLQKLWIRNKEIWYRQEWWCYTGEFKMKKNKVNVDKIKEFQDFLKEESLNAQTTVNLKGQQSLGRIQKKFNELFGDKK